MTNFLKIFDFLGVKPSLYYDKNTIHQTCLGGFLSIFTGCLVLSAVFFFSNILLTRTNYNITMYESRNDFPFKNWTNEQISVLLVDRYMNEIKDWDRLFGYYADSWWNKPSVNAETGLTTYKNEIKRVELEKCRVDHHFKGEEDLWRDQKLINSSICIKRDQQLPVQFLFGDLNFTSIVFWIHRCINNTIKTDCFPKEKIEKDLENVFLQVRFKDHYVDHSDFKIPEEPYIYSDMVQASSTAYKRTWYYFRNVIYQSDASLLFSETFDREFNSFAGTRDATDLRTSATIPGTFSVASFYNYPLKQTFKRKYYKIQNMMADAGGIVTGLVNISRLIFYFASWNLYYTDLINSNFFHYSGDLNLSASKQVIKNSEVNIIKIHLPASDNRFSNQVNNINIESVNRAIVQRQTEPVKLSKFQTFLPPMCHSKQNKMTNKYNTIINHIKKHFDSRELIKKINYVDKLAFIILGNNQGLLEMFENPTLKSIETPAKNLFTDNLFKVDLEKNLKILLGIDAKY
jgi:hypothetical protein